MAQILIDFLKNLIGNDILTVMLLSVAPFVEARGAIPFAFGLGMNPLSAFLFCVVSATAAIPIILFAFAPIVRFLKKFKLTNKVVSAFEDVIKEKGEKYAGKEKDAGVVSAVGNAIKEKSGKYTGKRKDEGVVSAVGNAIKEKAEKYAGKWRLIGEKMKNKGIPFIYKTLFLLAALPLPLTGIWSSSAVAAGLKLDKGWSFAAIACGNFVSSAILVVLLRFFSESVDIILNVFIGIIIAAIGFTIFKIIGKSRKIKASA
jgi:uncharacterized membrane protein